MEYESTSLRDESLSGRAKDLLAFVGVGTYLAGVGTYLRLRGKIQPATPLFTICHNHLLRRVYRSRERALEGPLGAIEHLERHAFRARIPVFETDMLGASRVRVYEDGVELPAPHACHSEIAGLGGGRYSHWGICTSREGLLGLSNYSLLCFSTSDNSDPRTNGRRYTYRAS